MWICWKGILMGVWLYAISKTKVCSSKCTVAGTKVWLVEPRGLTEDEQKKGQREHIDLAIPRALEMCMPE
ncbi:hypothetical protein C5167_032897, partial [Papaver somniferum]